MNKETLKKLEIKIAELVAMAALVLVIGYLVWKNVMHHG